MNSLITKIRSFVMSFSLQEREKRKCSICLWKRHQLELLLSGRERRK